MAICGITPKGCVLAAGIRYSSIHAQLFDGLPFIGHEKHRLPLVAFVNKIS